MTRESGQTSKTEADNTRPSNTQTSNAGNGNAGNGNAQNGNAQTSARPTLIAALAVLLSASAFAGVLADTRWVLPALLVVAGVTGIGLAGRTLRWWPPVIVLAQLVVVLVLLVIQFSGDMVLGAVPGMAGIAELGSVLSSALDLVRNGVPPIPADPAIQCLVCLGLGVVAILVDVIAVTCAAPAVAGLVLLCIFAIPASLAESMLPWGTFLAAAVGFALLLVSGGRHHHWGRGTNKIRMVFGVNVAAVVGTAAVLAMLTGSVFTGVGTEGRLPGDDGSSSAAGAIGLRPFTSLRGQLDRDSVVELFRVRGLPKEAYLRAMTLRKFDPRSGWKLDKLAHGVGVGAELPLPPGTDIQQGTPARVEITPVGYRDPWLPVFGVPTQVRGMGAQWRYDPAAGIVFTQTRQESRPYVEQLVLPNPSPEQLRTASGPPPVDQAYLDVTGVAPEIGDLAKTITESAPTNFDKAVALNRFFTDPANGFTYDLQTAPPKGNDALADFLFRGKRGFCEQYASSMAVLLREVGIPSRVAVGFTSGYPDGDEQVITTNDAHAWVEAYFPGSGWITFDPTPLDDGRTSLPGYLENQPLPGQVPPAADQPTTPQQPAPDPSLQEDPPDQAVPPPAPPSSGGGNWSATALVMFAIVLIAATPVGVREARRRRRIGVVARREPGFAETAWLVVLDELRDRGTQLDASQTLRAAVTDIVDKHGIDATGEQALNDIVIAVEYEWYAPQGQQAPTSIPESLHAALESLHRCSPLSWRDRLLPRSILPRRPPARPQHA